MAKDNFKLLNKLVDSILVERSFLDQNLESNLSTLDALIQSGLVAHLAQLNIKANKSFLTPYLANKDFVDKSAIRCVQAVAVVCTNMPSILLKKLIPNKQRPGSGNIPYYKALLTNLVRFFKFNNPELNSTINTTIITIVNLLTTKLRSFKIQRSLADFFINNLVTHYLTRSFGSISKESSICDLITSTCCFSLFYNYKIYNLLLLPGSIDLTMTSYCRKLWYLLSNMIVGSSDTQRVLDAYRSSFLKSCVINCISEDSISPSKVILCLEFINNLIHNFMKSPNLKSSEYIQNIITELLLELYLKCSHHEMENLFIPNINVSELLIDSKDLTKAINDDLLRALKIVCGLIFNEGIETELSKKKFVKEKLIMLEGQIIKGTELEFENKTVAENLKLIHVDNKTDLIIFSFKSNNISEWVDNLELLLEQESGKIGSSNLTLLKLIQSIGKFTCFYSNNYNYETGSCELCEKMSNLHYIEEHLQNITDHPTIEKLVRITIKYVLPMIESDVLIINLLITLKMIFVKYSLPKIITNDPLFKFFRGCMVSTNRDIRIFAGKILPLYLLHYDQNNNWNPVFEFLDKDLIVDQNTSYLAESKILAWGELAIISEGEHLNVLLAKLFDFFNSSNSFYTSAAYITLFTVATQKQKSCWQLVYPFFPNLSLVMVQQIMKKTIFGTIIPEFLGVSSKDILNRTLTYTVPYLLTYYSQDIIKEIAKVANIPKYQLVEQELSRIFAVMFTSSEYLDEIDGSFYINQTKIMDILTIVDPYFKKQQLADIIKSVEVIWEICKMYSVSEKNYVRLKNAIIFVIKLDTINKNPNSKTAQKVSLGNAYALDQDQNEEDERILQYCFKSTLLGIIQQFSYLIKDTMGKTPYLEKVRSLNAIEFLVQIAGLEIVTALPQICISLQKAISDPLLELNSLRCWKILIASLKDIHLSTCFDLVIAIILQRWKFFSHSSKKVAKELLIELFNKDQLIRDKYFNYYFTLSFNEALVDVYSKATQILKEKKSLNTDESGLMVLTLLYDITRRCNNDNKYVVQQALQDLRNFLNRYKLEFHGIFLHKEKFIGFIPSLIDVLMRNCSKFKSDEDEDDENIKIQKECATCLGIIGSLDPEKFALKEEDKKLICMFHNDRELLHFITKFLNVLVKAFWASEDPILQVFLAYGMQEFLKVIDVKDLSSVPFYNDLVISTLTPLALSQYELSPSGSGKLKNYPIFKLTKNHSEWVRDLTLDLIERSRLSCNSQSSKRQFEIAFYSIYSNIIRGQDLTISLMVLPYVVLNVIIKDFEGLRRTILSEFLSILETDCDNLNYTHEISKNIKMFYQTVFNIVDYLGVWLANRKQKQSSSGRTRSTLFGCSLDEAIKIVELFLQKIPDMLIAKRSSQCDSYERSVLYLEQSYRKITVKKDFEDENNKEQTESIIMELEKLYEKVDDYDTLTGVLKKFSNANIQSVVSQLQFEDNWNSTLNVFDLSLENQDEVKVLQYLNKKNLYSETLLRVKQKEAYHLSPEYLSAVLHAGMIEGDFENLEKWIIISGTTNKTNDSEFLLNLLTSKLLFSLKNHDQKGFHFNFENCQRIIGSLLSLSPTSSLARNKQLIDRLHVLEDLKEMLMNNDKNVKVFNDRFDNIGSDFESLWYILAMRKSGMNLINNNNKKISELWLKQSKLALEHNRLDLAIKSATVSDLIYHNHEAELQYAEILWAQGDSSKALKLVQTLRNDYKGEIMIQAKVQLKYAYWLESSNNALGSEIVREYEKAIGVNPKWEDPYYHLGKYFTKVLESTEKQQTLTITDGVLEFDIINNYLKCIQNGTKYLEEVLPKVVTLWIGYSCSENSRNGVLKQIEQLIESSLNSLPKSYWFAVYSQLLSRLPSTEGSTFSMIVDICAVVLNYYPEQLLWSVHAQYNSTDSRRQAAGKKIFHKFAKMKCKVQKYQSNKTIYQSANKLLTSFEKMTKLDPGRISETSLSGHYKFDHKVLPAPIAVPTKQNFDINNTNNNGGVITIVKFEDKVKVMTSLQRPRRIVVIGSDGKTYMILFKLNDDLRKDAKLMELTSMIHHLLEGNYESRKRNLHIKTFAVIPLNEKYGIIEWVQNHCTMKGILDKKYERKESIGHIKKQWETKKTLVDKLSYFKLLIEYFEPVLYRWFIEFFPTPNSWYNSRNFFTRSCAVMSMVGYILGIGDRHGENILISEVNGGVLHVDFDCLFEKGKTLKIPERVPFRLTNNMVDAFGISGTEGTFAKSSEVTMQLLRSNEPILMNILEAFLHDPIMDWKNGKIGPEVTLEKIRYKLRGILDKEALSMSVPGQVNYLIQEATSNELLCRMYFGWFPFW